MRKAIPSVLKMSQHQKEKTLEAIYEAIGIAHKPTVTIIKNCQFIKNENIKIRTMTRLFSRNTKALMALLVGRTQQRHLKRKIRQDEVWLESWKIARETGVSIEEIERLFLEIMSEYVIPKP